MTNEKTYTEDGVDVTPLLDHFWKTGEVIEIVGIDWEKELARDVWRRIDHVANLHKEWRTLDGEAALSGITPSMERKIDDIQKVTTRALLAGYLHSPDRHFGLSFKHIDKHDRFLAAMWLSLARQRISQEQFNFLTLADRGYYLSTLMYFGQEGVDWANYAMRQIQLGHTSIGRKPDSMCLTASQIRLAQAFSEQMLKEATGLAPITGNYIMSRTSLGLIDEIMHYDRLRLSFTPNGIWCSVVSDEMKAYAPLWWSASINPDCGVMDQKQSWLFHILLSCIWRDACVVRHKALHVRSRSEYKPSKKKRKQQSTLVLPRVVHHVDWSPPADREYITRIAHHVRGHYRELQDGQKSSQAAADNADLYGYPTAPDGFTFVIPHVRGKGEPAPQVARRVICKGLQVAKIALSSIEKDQTT